MALAGKMDASFIFGVEFDGEEYRADLIKNGYIQTSYSCGRCKEALRPYGPYDDEEEDDG